jgi:hypothetical protein
MLNEEQAAPHACGSHGRASARRPCLFPPAANSLYLSSVPPAGRGDLEQRRPPQTRTQETQRREGDGPAGGRSGAPRVYRARRPASRETQPRKHTGWPVYKVAAPRPRPRAALVDTRPRGRRCNTARTGRGREAQGAWARAAATHAARVAVATRGAPSVRV